MCSFIFLRVSVLLRLVSHLLCTLRDLGIFLSIFLCRLSLFGMVGCSTVRTGCLPVFCICIAEGILCRLLICIGFVNILFAGNCGLLRLCGNCFRLLCKCCRLCFEFLNLCIGPISSLFRCLLRGADWVGSGRHNQSLFRFLQSGDLLLRCVQCFDA